MSHWKSAALGLDCDIEVLQRALLNIMPEWAKHITVDTSGKLAAQNYWQEYEKEHTRSGFSIVIKLTGNEYGRGGDIGFKKLADGSWQVDYEGGVLPSDMRKYGVDKVVASEVMAMRAKVEADLFGHKVESDIVSGNKRTIRTLVPISKLPSGGKTIQLV